MKDHFCSIEKEWIGYEGQCNWCGEKELLPKRTWVGLSVFEINDLVENTEYEDYRDLVERTEAKLKEKNK